MNILFFDIDGTLAHGLDVPASTEKAIAEVRRKGDLSVICTGRPVGYAQKNFGKYADGFICFNGRYGVISDKVLYDVALTDDLVELLVKKMDSLKLGYMFMNNDHFFNGGYEKGEYHPLDTRGEAVYGLGVSFDDYDQFDKAREEMKQWCIFNPHYPHLHADVTVTGSDKGLAVKTIVEKLGIPFENTYAFGDGANDVSMFKAVAHGIAMGNGLPEAKEAAEYVTDDIDHDGIANALKRYRLI